MDYKTILVHVNDVRSMDACVGFAAQFAMHHDAHLVGIAQTGVQRFIYGTPPDGVLVDLTQLYADLQADAAQRARHFDALVRQAGLASFEHRIGDEEAGYALATQAMYGDLVIVGQSDPADLAMSAAMIPEYVALHAPCPVLVLPHAAPSSPVFERVLVAWNASPESARAVRQALPLLARAQEVEIATVCREEAAEASVHGAEAALYLARHGINVSLWQARTGGDVADTLLARVGDYHAALLVMGCYGHSRLRELLLGGVSRAVLRSMSVPTLMAH